MSRAGLPAEESDLIDIDELIAAYYERVPDPAVPEQRVAFGTSGHRGSSLSTSFNEVHILATTQAIVDYRTANGIAGPLFLGRDTHGLSRPAERSAIEVLVANGVGVRVDSRDSWVPTPALSHAILTFNRGKAGDDPTRADGIVVTPSHNPPRDGGFKYTPPHGGPAGPDITGPVQERANAILAEGLAGVKRMPVSRALTAPGVTRFDFITPYVAALADVIDLAAIADAKLKIGVDPMGGSGIAYWAPLAERYGLDVEVVNEAVDPTFAFMTLDKDGKIRMDCSSPWAMASLVGLKDRFDIAFGNDTDYDRHGIVTKGAGLLNPNHYLAVCVDHLFRTREWPGAAVGKTLVSSSMIDRVAGELGRPLKEVPVGFKWFVDGLLDGSFGFGGEESAGASFLRRDGTVWTTDKDGILLDLLAAEITATTGKDPAEHYAALTEKFGAPIYERVDAPATREQKAKLKKLGASDVAATELAGEPITAKLTEAPGNGAPIGGLKVTTESGWFAARPSGTEDVYKIYAESFRGEEHLRAIQEEARAIVASVIG